MSIRGDGSYGNSDGRHGDGYRGGTTNGLVVPMIVVVVVSDGDDGGGDGDEMAVIGIHASTSACPSEPPCNSIWSATC